MLHPQFVVNRESGVLDELYLWEDDFKWQASFALDAEGHWTAFVVDKDDDMVDHFLGGGRGMFATLGDALQAYFGSEWAAPSASLGNTSLAFIIGN